MLFSRGKKPPPEPKPPLTVTFPKDLSPSVCSRLTKDVIKHIWYMRQQIPCPFEEILRRVSVVENSTLQGLARRRQLNSIKRYVKFLKNANIMLETIDNLFSGREVESIVLVMGSSPLNVRESYVLKFGYDATNNSSCTVTEGNEFSRRLMRSIITSAVFNEGMLPPTKMYVMANISGSDIPDGLLAKHSFYLKTSQIMPTPILVESGTLGLRVHTSRMNVEDDDDEEWTDDENDDVNMNRLSPMSNNNHKKSSQGFSWYQVAKPTIGFRLQG